MSEAKSSGNLAKIIVGLVVTVGCLYLMLRKVSLDDLLHRFATVQWGYIVLATLSLAVGYAFRVLRWRIMLEAGSVRVRLLDCVPPFLGAITMNNILPLRTGDVLRAFVFPTSIGVGRVLSLTSLVAERALDVLILSAAIITGFLLTSNFAYPSWALPAVALLGTGLGVAIVAVAVFGRPLAALLSRWAKTPDTGRPSLKAKLAGAVAESFTVFLQIATPSVAVKLVVVSALSWLFEAGVFFCFFLSLGIPLYCPYSIIVMAIGTFSTLVPSSPGYVGPFHLAVSTLLVAYGLDAATATSYAVLVHLGLWLPTTVAGTISMALSPGLFRAGLGRNKSNRSVGP